MFIFLIIGAVIVVGTAVGTVAGPAYAISKLVKTIGLMGYPEGAGPLSPTYYIQISPHADTQEGRELAYLSIYNNELRDFFGKTFLLVKPEVQAINGVLQPISIAMRSMQQESAKAEFCQEAAKLVASLLTAVVAGAKLTPRRAVL